MARRDGSKRLSISGYRYSLCGYLSVLMDKSNLPACSWAYVEQNTSLIFRPGYERSSPTDESHRMYPSTCDALSLFCRMTFADLVIIEHSTIQTSSVLGFADHYLFNVPKLTFEFLMYSPTASSCLFRFK